MASFTEKVADLFKQFPNCWIDGMEIAVVGGRYAYRTRISNCRTELGMTIENRQRRVTRLDDPKDFFIVSEYRYVPAKSQAA